MMRREVDRKWDQYKPKTNVFWFHYLVTKMIEGVHYQRKLKAHLNIFREFRDGLLRYESAAEIAHDKFFADLIADEVVLNPLARLNMS